MNLATVKTVNYFEFIIRKYCNGRLTRKFRIFFKNPKKGILTFPTKFDYIEPLLNIYNKERLIPRISLNPENIIKNLN